MEFYANILIESIFFPAGGDCVLLIVCCNTHSTFFFQRLPFHSNLLHLPQISSGFNTFNPCPILFTKFSLSCSLALALSLLLSLYLPFTFAFSIRSTFSLDAFRYISSTFLVTIVCISRCHSSRNFLLQLYSRFLL